MLLEQKRDAFGQSSDDAILARVHLRHVDPDGHGSRGRRGSDRHAPVCGVLNDFERMRMFEQGLTQAIELPTAERNKMLKRLDTVRESLRGIGWGVSDAVNELWHDRVD